MKQLSLLLYVSLFFLLLAACSAVPETETFTECSALESSETQIPLEEQTLTIIEAFVETQDGYYYGNGTLLFFCPRDGERFIPLCSKPNCRHNSIDCNAYFAGFNHALGIFDGSIYTVDDFTADSELVFQKRNLDGTDHRSVAKLKLDEFGHDVNDLNWTVRLYRGKAYVYIYTRWYLDIPQEDHLIVVDLTDGSQSELAEDFFRERRVFAAFPSFQNGKMRTPAGKDKLTPQKDILVEVDLATGEGVELPFSAKTVCGESFTDSTVYYWERDVGENKPEHPGFKEYDRETGAIREYGTPVEVEGYWNALYDNDYAYLYNVLHRETTENLYIISKNGYNLVDQIPLVGGQDILAVTSSRIYLTDPDCEQYEGCCGSIYYIEKSQIGSHNINPVRVEIEIPKAGWVD